MRQAGALVLGVLLALAFPLTNVAGFAWIAPGGLLFLSVRGDGREAFQSGSLFGLAFALTQLYWLNYMPVDFLPTLAWMALGGYLAAWYGAWAWFAWWTLPAPDFIRTPWWRRAGWVIGVSAAWVVMEYVVGWLLTGFPWLRIGYTQGGLLPLLQIAAWIGVPGLSFLMVWFSISLVCGLLALAGEPNSRWLAWREIGLPLVAVAVLFAAGSGRINDYNRRVGESGDREVSVALVQPSFPQTLIWDSSSETNRLRRTLELSRVALASKPNILVWPEAGMPGLLRFQDDVHRQVTELARKHGVWLICGGDDARLPEGAADVSRPDFFNGAFLINPEGRIVSAYHKRRLVIFGEYVPLARWLPFLKFLTPIGEGFSAGREAGRFEMPSLGLSASPLICFEDIFPWLSRSAAGPDTDLLVNLTNDGWFGESAQQWQHLANARCRAIETGRPLIRCANNGISCWVDPVGRIHGVDFEDGRPAYSEGVKLLRVRVPPEPISTPYGRRGEWFAWFCGGLAVLTGWSARSRSTPSLAPVVGRD